MHACMHEYFEYMLDFTLEAWRLENSDVPWIQPIKPMLTYW
jgi:hypothetical protein